MENHDQDSEHEIEFTAEQTNEYEYYLVSTTRGERGWFYEVWKAAEQPSLVAGEE